MTSAKSPDTLKRIPIDHPDYDRHFQARFWSKVLIGGDDDCWPWLGAKGGKGYGRVRYKGRLTRAHAKAYELAIGPIENGLHALHKCDNPTCCNPSHIFPGTNADNMADRASKGRTWHKFTEAQVLAMLDDRAAGMSEVALGYKYGMNSANVHYIVAGVTWRHLQRRNHDD